MMPGRVSGRVTVRNTHIALAPSVAEAASSFRSTASMESRMARTISGKPITAQARAAPVQRKAKTMPNCARNAPTGPLVPKVSNSR